MVYFAFLSDLVHKLVGCRPIFELWKEYRLSDIRSSEKKRVGVWEERIRLLLIQLVGQKSAALALKLLRGATEK